MIDCLFNPRLFRCVQCARMETWTSWACASRRGGNVKWHLPGIARLVSGIVCMLCGKLDIQSANRWSHLPWDEAMLPPCTTRSCLLSPRPGACAKLECALSPSLTHSLTHSHAHAHAPVRLWAEVHTPLSSAHQRAMHNYENEVGRIHMWLNSRWLYFQQSAPITLSRGHV